MVALHPDQDIQSLRSTGGESTDVPQPDPSGMEIDSGDSPIRTEEELFLLTGEAAEEDHPAGGPPTLETIPGAEAAIEAKSTESTDEGATGGETPSVGLSSGMSNLAMASPEATVAGESAEWAEPKETLVPPHAQRNSTPFTLDK